jgi:hypothetical protein
MQMGRWFGFRARYKDLVRLYIGRGAPGTAATALDLLLRRIRACPPIAGALPRRARALRQGDDGVPSIAPAQVPPLVAQRLGWLTPAAFNKIYNARLVDAARQASDWSPSVSQGS